MCKKRTYIFNKDQIYVLHEDIYIILGLVISNSYKLRQRIIQTFNYSLLKTSNIAFYMLYNLYSLHKKL
jgi:hypothetical protein